jgi:hypothetical protein
MDDLGVAGPAQFQEWLQEETTYLQGLRQEPPEEVWQMDYYELLQKLAKAE